VLPSFLTHTALFFLFVAPSDFPKTGLMLFSMSSSNLASTSSSIFTTVVEEEETRRRGRQLRCTASRAARKLCKRPVSNVIEETDLDVDRVEEDVIGILWSNLRSLDRRRRRIIARYTARVEGCAVVFCASSYWGPGRVGAIPRVRG